MPLFGLSARAPTFEDASPARLSGHALPACSVETAIADALPATEPDLGQSPPPVAWTEASPRLPTIGDALSVAAGRLAIANGHARPMLCRWQV